MSSPSRYPRLILVLGIGTLLLLCGFFIWNVFRERTIVPLSDDAKQSQIETKEEQSIEKQRTEQSQAIDALRTSVESQNSESKSPLSQEEQGRQLDALRKSVLTNQEK